MHRTVQRNFAIPFNTFQILLLVSSKIFHKYLKVCCLCARSSALCELSASVQLKNRARRDKKHKNDTMAESILYHTYFICQRKKKE